MGRFSKIKLIVLGVIFMLGVVLMSSEEVTYAVCALVSSATPSFNTGGNTTVSFSGTAGNTLTVGLLVSNFGATPTVQDNLATMVPDSVSTKDTNNASQVFHYHHFNIGSGETTITINNGGAGGTAYVVQFSGGTNVTDIKQTTGGSTSSKATFSPSLSGVLAQANEIVFADAGALAGTLTISSGPTNSYSEIGNSAIKLNGTGTLVGATLITSATTTTNTAWTMSAAQPYSSELTTYECTGGAAAAPVFGVFYVPLEDRLGFTPMGLVPISNHYE